MRSYHHNSKWPECHQISAGFDDGVRIRYFAGADGVVLLGFLAAVVDAPALHVNVCGAGVLELDPIATLAIRVSGSFRIAGIDLVDDYGWFGSRVLFVRSRSGHADQGDAAQCHRSGEQRD